MKTFWIGIGLTLCIIVLAPARARAQSGITDRSRNGVTCASDDGRRHYCAVNTSRGVQMVKQRSGSPCVQGQTWGYDKRGIWVDRGCRAEFALGSMAGGPNPGNRPGYPGNRPGPPPPPPGQVVTCSSSDGRRSQCRVDTSRGVRMVTQRSGSPCVLGKTWGYDHAGIWVDRGCRADFALGTR